MRWGLVRREQGMKVALYGDCEQGELYIWVSNFCMVVRTGVMERQALQMRMEIGHWWKVDNIRNILLEKKCKFRESLVIYTKHCHVAEWVTVAPRKRLASIQLVIRHAI